MKKSKFTFIDLFSGIGGFHQAMSKLGGECVFASDIDIDCAKIYKKNYSIDSYSDITKVSVENIPKHDVLCAGFPCQAFSKAGKQAGINDARGTLFYDIARILEHHKPKFFILENVRNFVSHDSGNTWAIVKNILRSLGYRLTYSPLVLSPHQFGVPQFRERVYILGQYDPNNVDIPIEIELPNLLSKSDNTIDSILDLSEKIDKKYLISLDEEKILNIWDEFYKGINIKSIGFPVWVDYLNNKNIDNSLPSWKTRIIEKNQFLYNQNKEFIDSWLENYQYLKDYSPSWRKFEWQAGTSISSLWDGVIQFRPSGIRIKRPDVFSTLVALVQTQIIGKYKRRLTIKEAGKLQSFTDNFIFHEKDHISYRQLGNSVNVRILYELGLRLFSNVFINELYITNKEQLVDLVYSLIDAKKKSDNFSDAIIADYLGMTRQSYQTIKNRKSFGIDILFKILKLLNCDLKIHFNSKNFSNTKHKTIKI